MSIPQISITIDVEWVPSLVIEEMRSLLDDRNVPATFFCTSEPALKPSRLHEFALHPNFTGLDSWESVLSPLRALYPAARGIRTHCLHSDTRMARRFPEH